MISGPIAVDDWVVSEGKTFLGRRFVRAQSADELDRDFWVFDERRGLRQCKSIWRYSAIDLPNTVRDAMLRLYRGYESS